MSKRVSKKNSDENNIHVVNAKMLLKIGIVLCILFAMFYFRDYFTMENAKNMFTNIQSSVTGDSAQSKVKDFNFIGDKRNQYLTYRDRLVVVGIDGIKMYDERRSIVDTIPLPYEKPVAQSGNKYMLCYEMGSNNLTVIQDDKIHGTITTDGNILSAEVNNAGFFAVVTSKSGSKSVVTVYNSALQPIYVLRSNNSVMDVALSPLSDSMSVLSADTSGDKIISKLTAYHFNNKEPIGEFVTEDAFLLDVYYQDANIVSVLSEKDLRFFNGKAEEKGNYDFSSRYVTAYDLTPQRYSAVVLSENKTGSKSYVRSIGNDGALRGEYMIRNEIKDIRCSETMICILTQDKLTVLNNKCEFVKEIVLEEDVRNVIMSKTGVFLIGQTWAKNMPIS